MFLPARAAIFALATSVAGFARVAAAQRGVVPLRHLDHTAWTRDDVPALRGAYRIARSNDGYLWVNARNGVLRFDGTRFVLLDSTASPLLRVRSGGEIVPLLVDRAGRVWLRRSDGALLTYRDGAFQLAVAASSATAPTEIAMDGAGRLFGYRISTQPTLVALRDGRAVPVPLAPDIARLGITRIVPDTGHGMWVGGPGGLWHVVDGRAERVAVAGGEPGRAATPLVQTRDGTLWATGLGVGPGLERIVDGHAFGARAADSAEIVDAYQAVEDSSGAVWFSTHGSGVLRWANGRLESFTRRDGLSDVLVYDVTVDARGVALMATAAGIDRLRPTPFVTLGAADGIRVESPQRIVRDESGALWTSGIDGQVVTRLEPSTDPFAIDRVGSSRASLPPNDSYTVLGAARGGGVWIGTRDGALFRYRDGRRDRRLQVPSFSGRALRFVVEQADGDLWVGREQLGLALVRDEHFITPPVSWASAVAEDARGHLWVADAETPVLDEIVDGRIVRRIGRAEGLPGFVSSLVVERDDLLWAMTDSGIARIAGGRVSLVHGPPIEFVQRYGPELLIAGRWLWFASDDRIGRIELAALEAAANGKPTPIVVRDAGPSDGLTSPRRFVYQMQVMQRGFDGRVWFATSAGLAIFDPSRDTPPRTPLVRVEEVAAHGGAFYGTARSVIAANPNRIEIHFAAPDLAFPERDRLQYRLAGVDHEWIDAGASRLATYTQVRPGSYDFYVRAWSADAPGGPPAEATLAFRVAPAWYQLAWLRGLAGLILACLIALATRHWQRRRSHAAAARMQAQFDTRLAERTRIARDLHDTLLQGFTGLVLQLEGLRQTIGRTPTTAAADELSRILLLADTTLFEARQSVWDMRRPDLDRRGLARALEASCRELIGTHDVALTFTLAGTERQVPAEIEATAFHVCQEALRNAVAHSRAARVEVGLRYTRDAMELRVADDGVGMSRHQLDGASNNGHFGILGMRERAAAAGGTLDVQTAVGDGTCVALTLPCAVGAGPTLTIPADAYLVRPKRARDSRPSFRE